MAEISLFRPTDYDEVIVLWRTAEGLTLREVDSRAAISQYLERNPGLSFIARDTGRLVGAVLAGTDGRRGYLQHLAVVPAYRRQGLGRALVQRVIMALRSAGITKCHLFVRVDNEAARAFWLRLGWTLRDDVTLMSFADGSRENP
jgi:ribosomal protein S18 acetylase RimI-like enzyme